MYLEYVEQLRRDFMKEKHKSREEAMEEYPEVEVYDILNLIREKLNGGWTYTDKYLEKIDQDILEEEQRGRSLRLDPLPS